MVNWFITIFLLLIVYEDFKYREVHIALFIILPVLFLVKRTPVIWELLLTEFFINSSFICLLLVSVWLTIVIRKKSLNLLQGLGLGDILFLIELAILFTPMNFIVFVTISFLVALILDFILKRVLVSYLNQETVPLAGIQGACLIIAMNAELTGLL